MTSKTLSTASQNSMDQDLKATELCHEKPAMIEQPKAIGKLSVIGESRALWQSHGLVPTI